MFDRIKYRSYRDYQRSTEYLQTHSKYQIIDQQSRHHHQNKSLTEKYTRNKHAQAREYLRNRLSPQPDEKTACSSNRLLLQNKIHQRAQRKFDIQQVFKPLDRNQIFLLLKINCYLEQQKRDLRLSLEGYCHGISLLWLYKMSEQKVQWFYDVVDKIAGCPYSKLLDIEMDIEKFLAHIEWAQSSVLYTEQDYYQTIDYWNVDKILELPQVEAHNRWFTDYNMIDFLRRHFNKEEMIVLSSWTWYRHSIGIFSAGGKYFLFDPNYKTGRAQIIDDPGKLLYEIKKCFYTTFYLPMPFYYMPLEIHIVQNPEKIAERLPPAEPLVPQVAIKKRYGAFTKSDMLQRRFLFKSPMGTVQEKHSPLLESPTLSLGNGASVGP